VVTLLQTWVVIFFLRGGFLITRDSAGSMAQRDNRRLDIHHTAAGAMRRCPVQSSTPLGPDQVNVLLLLDNRLQLWVPGCTPPYGGCPGRCPVQPGTPLGPDEVNVLLLFI
jgi:hypothetical protein